MDDPRYPLLLPEPRPVRRALLRAIGSRPVMFEVPAVGTLAVGALLVQLGIIQTPDSPTGVLSQNIWFNLGIVLAVFGLALALIVPALAVREQYRLGAFLDALENQAVEGVWLYRRIQEAAVVADINERAVIAAIIEADAKWWANRVARTLRGAERHVLRGYFLTDAGFVEKDYRTDDRTLERIAAFVDEHRVRLAEIILKVS